MFDEERRTYEEEAHEALEEMKALKIDINTLACEDCPDMYRKPCIKEGGEPRDDGDDHRAFHGSHHCRASWHQFNVDCINKHAEKS